MKTPKSLILLLAMFVALISLRTPTNAQTPPSVGSLTVNVEGFKTSEGKLVVKVFRKEDDIFGKPFLQQVVTINELATIVKFAEVPYGQYAVFAYHDKNNNGVIDHNAMGLPKEPMGWSNHWNFSLFKGMPTFDKTKFLFSADSSSLTILLK